MKQKIEQLLASLNINAPVLYPKPEFGDYAVNLAKFAKGNLGEVTPKIIAEIRAKDTGGIFEEVIQAGSFVNFRLSKKALLTNLQEIEQQKNKFGTSHVGQGQTVIVEYFQNNVAKPPHVGHLRSAVIGDSLKRIFTALGYNTLSDTHVGDWGVQFGILLHAYKTMGSREVVEKDPIQELNKLYVEESRKIAEDPALRELGKQEFVKLEQGDEENRKLWQWFVDESLKDFERYRKLLKLKPFDLNYGEAFYEDKMAEVLKELEDKGLVKVGEQGEKYVDLETEGLGRCILVKSDGGTTYHMRDFATYTYIRKTHPYFKHIYAVDSRQSHHFKQLFRILELAGYPAETDAVHVDIGFMSLPEGPISTRKGTVISLEKLITEAASRSLVVIKEKNPNLENKEEVAGIVGLAAIKYFDLSHNRKSEVEFSWDKAISFDGNTGPYMLYTYARIQGILRKVASSESRVPSINYSTELEEQELYLLRKLVYFPEMVEQAGGVYLPSLICSYLFELSQLLNTFYEAVQVASEEDLDKKKLRISLISAVGQVVQNGLELLGIETVPRM